MEKKEGKRGKKSSGDEKVRRRLFSWRLIDGFLQPRASLAGYYINTYNVNIKLSLWREKKKDEIFYLREV